MGPMNEKVPKNNESVEKENKLTVSFAMRKIYQRYGTQKRFPRLQQITRASFLWRDSHRNTIENLHVIGTY